jgi:formylmethanofuran--tetrahydromethanopterin N-formyltransferase
VEIGGTTIIDTFAEAFRVRFARLIVTAHDQHWLEAAARSLTGYATSVIACDAEAGIERWLPPEETPDERSGFAALVIGFSAEKLAKALANRTGQCLMTCPTTAVFDGLRDADERVPLGKHIRFFGDGFQKSKQVAGRRYWRVPVMDGEFLIEDKVGVGKGVGGGNLIIQAARLEDALASVRRAVAAIDVLPGVVMPFPGGVARSGSKVGARYKGLPASTADAYCPTLRGRVQTNLVTGANCALEIVVDGIDEAAVSAAMRAGLYAAAGDGVLAIGAGNYGGKLGKFHFHLRQLVEAGV